MRNMQAGFATYIWRIWYTCFGMLMCLDFNNKNNNKDND